MSFGGRLPSDTEIGEGGYHGETYGAEYADLAYKGLGGTVPPHSRAVSTSPSACYALRVLNGCCNHLSFFIYFCWDEFELVCLEVGEYGCVGVR